MALAPKVKEKVIGTFREHATDTGSAEVQIALLSKQMDELIKHLKSHKKDNHSRKGLLKMVSKRKRLLKYLEHESPKRYAKVAKKLGLKS
jgi:small subunit ribosomal protein S15